LGKGGEFEKVNLINKPKTEREILFFQMCNILFKARNLSWEGGVKKSIANNYMDMTNFGVAILDWVKKNPSVSPKILKAVISILIRESKVSPMNYYTPKEILGFIHNLLGGDHSQGYSQIKPSTAKQYNIDIKSVYTLIGSMNATYKILSADYQKARNLYKGNTLTVFQNNQLKKINSIGNDSALHMTFASYNAGSEIMNQWCQTNIPNIANPCSENKRQVDDKTVAVTDKTKKINNYFPNIGNVHRYMPQIKILYDTIEPIPNIINKINSLT
jgi:hypothetical protein